MGSGCEKMGIWLGFMGGVGGLLFVRELQGHEIDRVKEIVQNLKIGAPLTIITRLFIKMLNIILRYI